MISDYLGSMLSNTGLRFMIPANGASLRLEGGTKGSSDSHSCNGLKSFDVFLKLSNRGRCVSIFIFTFGIFVIVFCTVFWPFVR